MMLKRVIAGIVIAMLMAGTAGADVPSPSTFDRWEFDGRLLANFKLFPSHDKADTLRLVASALREGTCLYSLRMLSGDTALVLESGDVVLNRRGYKHDFTFEVPEEGGTAQYRLTADYFMNGGVQWHASRTFSKLITVSRFNGTAYVFIGE